MRGIIREWALYVASLFLLDSLFAFISISNLHILLAAATSLYLLNTIGRPFLKILWLPINIVTLGLFSWVLNIVVILIVLFLVPGFTLSPLHIQSFEIGRFIFPEIILKMIWTYFAFTFILAWTVSFLRWLLIER